MEELVRAIHEELTDARKYTHMGDDMEYKTIAEQELSHAKILIEVGDRHYAGDPIWDFERRLLCEDHRRAGQMLK